MGKPIKFTIHKRVNSSKNKQLYGYQPESFILFQGERIGHIIGGKVYIYIAIKHGEGEPEETKCLNYTPELWAEYPDHVIARSKVLEHSELMWNNLNIFHSLKQQPIKEGIFNENTEA